MIYPEPIMIKVKSQVVVNKTKIYNNLTWLQRKVCKLFKIEPAAKYSLEVNVVTEQPCMARPNDVCMDAIGNMWVVERIVNENIIKVKSMRTIISEGIVGDIVVVSSMYSEGKGS